MNVQGIATRCRIRAYALGWSAVLLLGWTAAAAEELPRSDACRAALHALEKAESALMVAPAASAGGDADGERQRAIAARLHPQRQRVADACLGGLTTSPPPSQRNWTAPLPQRDEPPRSPLTVRPPERPPMPRFEPLVTLGHCNAATCVGSDGSTLTRVGPLLVGPRGVCTRQGVFVSCP